MKKTSFSIIAVVLCVVLAAFVFSACKKADDKATEATTATTTATTAATTAATTVAGNQGGQSGQSGQSKSSQGGSSSGTFTQQDAINNAVERAVALYGAGDWRTESCVEATAPDGAHGYKVGLINYANSQSPTYYFYSGYLFCYPAEDGSAEDQQIAVDQQKAVQVACERAAELYGQGNWGQVSCEPATSPDGASCYLVGVVNYDDAQSPTYYFYSGYQFVYPAQ